MIVGWRVLARSVGLVAMATFSVLWLDLFYGAFLHPNQTLIISTNEVGEGFLECVLFALTIPFIVYLFLDDIAGYAKCVACRLKYKNDS